MVKGKEIVRYTGSQQNTVKRLKMEHNSVSSEGEESTKADKTDEKGNWQLSKKKVLDRLHHLLDSTDFCDCTVVVGHEEKSFSAHKVVLAMSSPKFRDMLYSDGLTKNSFKLPDMQPEVFKAMLEYMYTDKLSLQSSQDAGQVLLAAKEYELPHLYELCSAYLVKELGASNVWNILKLAESVQDDMLTKECMKILRMKTSDVLEHPSFLEVDRSILLKLLSEDFLKISESDLFAAIKRWAERRCKEDGHPLNGKSKRKVLGVEILGKVRYLSFKSKEFAEGPAMSEILTLEEMCSIFMNLASINLHPMPEGFCKLTAPRNLPELRCVRKIINTVSQNVPSAQSVPFGQSASSAFTFTKNIPVSRVFGGAPTFSQNKSAFGQNLSSSGTGLFSTACSFGGTVQSCSSQGFSFSLPQKFMAFNENGTFSNANFSVSVKVSNDIILHAIHVPSRSHETNDNQLNKLNNYPFSKEYEESLTVNVFELPSHKSLSTTIFEEKVEYGTSFDICLTNAVHMKKDVEYLIEILTSGVYVCTKKLSDSENCASVVFTLKDFLTLPPVKVNSRQEAEWSFVSQLTYSLSP